MTYLATYNFCKPGSSSSENPLQINSTEAWALTTVSVTLIMETLAIVATPPPYESKVYIILGNRRLFNSSSRGNPQASLAAIARPGRDYKPVLKSVLQETVILTVQVYSVNVPVCSCGSPSVDLQSFLSWPCCSLLETRDAY